MTWQIIKESYIKDHLAKTYLKQPERRLHALDAIEALLRSQHPEYFEFFKLLCKKQVFDQQFSEKLVSADFGKQLLHILIDKAVMRQRAAASLLGA